MGEVREGKVKAAFAHLYPGLPVDEWRPARDIVEAQLARFRRVRNPMDLTRVLAERHFEFRGGQAQARPPDARERREDCLSQAGMNLDSQLEDVLLAASRGEKIDLADSAAVVANEELENIGMLELRKRYESMSHEGRLYAIAVLRLTERGEAEVKAIKARRGIA